MLNDNWYIIKKIGLLHTSMQNMYDNMVTFANPTLFSKVIVPHAISLNIHGAQWWSVLIPAFHPHHSYTSTGYCCVE